MVTNIVEAIQENLGYQPLKKVDPNTQEIKEAKQMSPEQRLAQAAIPAVLAAMIKYAGINPAEAKRHMEKISDEAVKIAKDSVKTPDAEKLRSFMNSQRHSILSHLPAVMKMGDVLNEETFDDRTNKMEGPVSSFLHKIEDII